MKKIILTLCVLLISASAFSQNISVDLKDSPVRTTLEMMFKQAGIKNYVIENSVAGFVTMKLEDQPFENSLKLVMRAATVPLTYTKENDVWIVKSRVFTEFKNTSPEIKEEKVSNVSFQVIRLNHIDPFDLQSVFGQILFINQGTRFGGNMNRGGRF
jgi:type II secretory pathway component HofQ